MLTLSRHNKKESRVQIIILMAAILWMNTPLFADSNIAQQPLFLSRSVQPLVMLNLSNDHQLYFEAYPDYADLSGDGLADRTYQHSVDYFGYFDPYKCYAYESNIFVPKRLTNDKYCTNEWSGNFLNWISMSRIDVVRKILYGGYRSTDTSSQTILERSYIPSDAHSWVKYYNGSDLNQLTPFNSPQASTARSNSSHTLTTTNFRDSNNAKTFAITSGSFSVKIGDQIRLSERNSPENYMYGVVTTASSSSITVQVNGIGANSVPGKQISDWDIINPTRAGMSFCNTTWDSNSTNSQDVTSPPKIRMAEGNYSLWTANERWQCAWSGERSRTGHTEMRIGGISFSNGNEVSISGIYANSDNPTLNDGNNQEFNARVSVCVEGLHGTENCKQYQNGNYKPIGLLQRYGDTDQIHFGLLTGSYSKNKSGGMLRKNIGSFLDEVNPQTGQFLTPDSNESIVGTLNRLRIYGYQHGSNRGTYAGDNCSEDTPFNNGNCSNWGNPQAEIFLESLRYLAGLQPTAAFIGNDSSYITGLNNASWIDPYTSANYCASTNIIQFNASITSYDNDELSGISDIWPNTTAKQLTDIIGSGEGVHGNSYFVGVSGTANNRYCTGKLVSSLGDIFGICPEGPNLSGSYHIAGLAHKAYTSSIRSISDDNNQVLTNEVFVQTYGVSLAPAVPKIEISIPNSSRKVTILPACDNKGPGTTVEDRGRCALADFKVIDQDTNSGSFLITWDISEAGMDFDMDLNGVLTYSISSNNQITVTTRMFAQSSGRKAGFGYIISGTTADGFHAHSGINNYTFNDPTSVPGCNNCTVDNSPTSYTYNITTSTADSLEDPLFYAAKWGGFDKEQSINFPSSSMSWDSNSDGLPDNYFFAINPAQLSESLATVFDNIAESSSAAAATAANSTRLQTDNRIYQAVFESRFWSGQLISYSFSPYAANPESRMTELWRVPSETTPLPNWASRKILIHRNPDTVNFTWNAFTPAQQENWFNNDQNLLNYLRGDRTNEGIYRIRASELGDIVNSSPVYAGPELSFGHNIPGYSSFLTANQNRPGMIYVGSNSGMLHGFDASTGDEKFAFIPSEILPSIKNIADPNYTHQYFVDGQQHVAHVQINGSWETILVGSLGAGGRSIYALKVTDPDNPTVLWEFTDSDLGYTFGRPTIGQLDNGQWVVVFGNGYESPSQNAILYVVDIATGQTVPNGKITTSISGNNGLSAPTVVVDDLRTMTYAFAGDLRGNMWKFDLRSSVLSISFNNQPLYQAGNNQPITTKPAVGAHPAGGYMVYFGTGKYFENTDNLSPTPDSPVHSFYGIRDGSVITSKTQLLQQSIIWQGTLPISDSALRVTSNNVYQGSERGWYIDLIYNDNKQGERVIATPIIRHGRIIFTTLIPNADPCGFGGESWLMELSALTGSRLSYSVFDIDGDGAVNDGDEITIVVNGQTITVPVSGLASNVGIINTPTIIGDGATEFKVLSGSTGELQTVTERGDGRSRTRTTWRQLQ